MAKLIFSKKVALISVAATSVAATAIVAPVAVITTNNKQSEIANIASSTDPLNGSNSNASNKNAGGFFITGKNNPSSIVSTGLKNNSSLVVNNLLDEGNPVVTPNLTEEHFAELSSEAVKSSLDISGDIGKGFLIGGGVAIGAGILGGISIFGIRALINHFRNRNNSNPYAQNLSLSEQASTANKVLFDGKKLTFKDVAVKFPGDKMPRLFSLPYKWFVDASGDFQTTNKSVDLKDFFLWLEQNPEQKNNKFAYTSYAVTTKKIASDRSLESLLNGIDETSADVISPSKTNVRSILKGTTKNSNQEKTVKRVSWADPLTILASSVELLNDKVSLARSNSNASSSSNISHVSIDDIELPSSSKREEIANDLAKALFKYEQEKAGGNVSEATARSFNDAFFKYIDQGKDTESLLSYSSESSGSISSSSLDSIADALKEASKNGITTKDLENAKAKIHDAAAAYTGIKITEPDRNVWGNADTLMDLNLGEKFDPVVKTHGAVPTDKDGKYLISNPSAVVGASNTSSGNLALVDPYVLVTSSRKSNVSGLIEVNSFFVPNELLNDKHKKQLEKTIAWLWADPNKRNNPFALIQKDGLPPVNFIDVTRSKTNAKKDFLPVYNISPDKTSVTLSIESFNGEQRSSVESQLKEQKATSISQLGLAGVKIDEAGRVKITKKNAKHKSLSEIAASNFKENPFSSLRKNNQVLSENGGTISRKTVTFGPLPGSTRVKFSGNEQLSRRNAIKHSNKKFDSAKLESVAAKKSAGLFSNLSGFFKGRFSRR